MKYSVGITNAKKKRSAKRSKRKGLSRAFSPTSLSKYKNFKKYNSRNLKKKRNALGGKPSKKEKKKMKLKTKKILYVVVGIGFFFGCVVLIGIGIYLKNLQNSLPSPDQLVERSSDQSTQILDREGELLYTVYGDKNREFVSIEDIPKHTRWAVLAAEDIEFYQHKGVDYLGILKAATQNLTAGTIVRGASTITQQLVKSTILYDVLGEEAYSQNYARKVKEVLITMQVEQTFSKDEILQMYMNEVPLGGVNYGFQAAANAYFAKDVHDLTLAESALIAGLIQSPGVYSPLYGANPELAENRKEYVLNQMLKNKKYTGVTEEEIEEAREEELVYATKEIDIDAPHFVFYVKQILEEEFGVDRVERGGLKVTTSLDMSLQEIAEEEVVKGVEGARRLNVNNGAMVVINPKNGQVLAMVGSVDYFNTEDPRVDGNVNIAVSERQMGSSIKPFVYLSAINKGYGPWLLTPDIPQVQFGNYKPSNWDRKHYGLMTARKALVLSRNVPSVYTLQLAGIDNFLQIIEKAGVTSMTDMANYGLSLGLGSGEMKLVEFTNAYATLANQGIRNDITAILKVENSRGEVLMETEENTGKRVFDEKEVYLVNWMICDLAGFNDRVSNQYYYAGNSKLCGKTGTTDGPRDLLAFLYNENLAVGVWTGNNNNEDMPSGWSTTVPLPLANSFFKRVIENYPSGTYNRPAGVMTTSVCLDTGASASEDTNCDKEASLYITGRPPQKDARKTVKICTANGLAPNNLDAATKYGLVEDKVLLSTKLENTFQQEAYEQYLSSVENSRYIFKEPESAACPLPLGPENAPVVEVSLPTSNQSVVRSSNLEISGEVRYLESITEFKVKFDGSDISGASLKADGTFVVNYFVPAGTSLGNHTIVVSAKDNYGKSNSQSIAITVVDPTSTITVSIASPANSVTVSFPVTLLASVSGGSVDEVSFSISKVGGGYSKVLTDSNGSNGWNQSWTSEDITNGSYKITVSAKSGGSTINGNSITVNY